MTLNPYRVFVTPAARDDWRAIAGNVLVAQIIGTLAQAILVEHPIAKTLVPDGFDPKRLYYVADSPTRGRLVFVLRPNNPGETGHTLTRVMKEQR